MTLQNAAYHRHTTSDIIHSGNVSMSFDEISSYGSTIRKLHRFIIHTASEKAQRQVIKPNAARSWGVALLSTNSPPGFMVVVGVCRGDLEPHRLSLSKFFPERDGVPNQFGPDKG